MPVDRKGPRGGREAAVVMVVVQELAPKVGKEVHHGAAAVVLWMWCLLWRRRGSGERRGSERERGRFGSVSASGASSECAARAGAA